MLKKIKNFCFNDYTPNWVGLGCLILVTIAIFTFGFNDFVRPIFVYPEEEYITLEKEAKRIINEQTLNVEFEHVVNYSNTLENKSVEIKLFGNDASVVIDVDNYGEATESVSVYRNQTKGVMYCMQNIALLILAIVWFAFVIAVLVMLILFILGAVCKFLDWMITALRY